MSIARAATASTLLIVSTHVTAADALGTTGHSTTPMWIWICTAAACIVFALIVHSVIAFQPSDSSSELKAAHNTIRELAWTIVPIVIVIAAAAPAMANFAFGSQASMTREVHGCGVRRTCRQYSFSQLINHGVDHCAAVLANGRTTSVEASPQIAGTCPTH
jgi:heme/copper-type cytochrome/quinol oxidase subunit 2